jgi:hypothetical protein
MGAMISRLPHFLLLLFLLSATNDTKHPCCHDLSPSQPVIAKQTILPLALQYRQQLLKDIESWSSVADIAAMELVDKNREAPAFSHGHILPPALANSDPLFGFMSLQL